ncbi:MAG: chaperonin GroEL [Candidatus Woesearchaeota archaeon]
MTKEVLFKEVARNELVRGIDIVANAVKETLGPRGRYVAIDKGGRTEIINDGVSVAKSIELSNKRQEAGAQLIKEVASKTQDLAGDGTTTATVLMQAILKEGIKYINSGANPIEIRTGIEKASKKVVSYLQEHSTPITNKEQIASVATISANNDEEIGKLIAEAMEKVGNDGVITVEEASAMETSVDVKSGMEFNQGYLSPYMVTDSQTKEVNFENPYILITDYSISSLKDILPALQVAGEDSRPLLIICDDLQGEALGGVVINLMRGTIKLAAVKTPGFGDEKKELLKDIAALTGARAIIKDEKSELKELKVEDLGTAHKVKVTKDNTTIVEGKGKELDKRVDLIKGQLENARTQTEKKSLLKRLASLTGGVAVLKIGASTQTEMKDKKHRVDDALNATRAAVEEGIIVGGGCALLRASGCINESEFIRDEQLGAKIVKEALSYPFKLILENGGLDSSIIKYNALSKNDFNYGYNAKTDTYEDLIKSGVIDPLKVTRLGLQNAASISSLVLTTQALIVDEPGKNDSESIGGGFDPSMMM